MEDVISKIKDRVDIVDLISGYLKLQKSGINYKARCPFHNEKTPSFFVSPERQIWHCFGCQAGGDIFGFVKQIEGVEFGDALRILAARAGIELHRQSPEYQQYQTAKTKLYEICALAMRFFEKQLRESGAGKKVIAYLYDRGLTDESMKNFHLGYAPDSWSALGDFLQRNYDVNDIFGAGLAVKKDGGGYYDRFRSRIMFPIFDLNGQVVGFSGRVFGDLAKDAEAAKYVNTPQTAIYDKSRVLYGLDKAKLDIRRKNKCLVVEGNMDVIMSHQAGAANVVASSGTALTDGHLRIIKRYTDNLDLCFDADSAGEIATARGVDLALARGFNVGIIAIEPPASEPGEPELKDPADYVKKYGSGWLEYSQKSRPFLEFYFETAKKTLDIATALGKKLMAQKLLPFLASMTNKIEQAHWISEIALALKLKEDILIREMSLVRPKDLEVQDEQQSQGGPKEEGFDILEEGILTLIMKKPDLVLDIRPENAEFLSDRLRGLVNNIGLALGEINRGGGNEMMARLTSTVEPGLAMNLEFIYLKSQELWKDVEDNQLAGEFKKILDQIRRRKILARLEDLEFDIKTAEKNKEKEKLATLTAEFSKVSKQLAQ
jgi:DNA primase